MQTADQFSSRWRKLLVTVAILLFVLPAFSAPPGPSLFSPEWKFSYSGPHVGINGFNNVVLEAGYHVLRSKNTSGGIASAYTCMLGGSIEMQVHPDFRIHPKLLARFSFERRNLKDLQPLCGADYLMLNDFDHVNHVFRPVIGFQYSWIGPQLVYGYNLRMDRNPSVLPSRHNIQLTLPLFLFWLMG